MTTALSASIHALALVPSENWDDDFEFQQKTHATNSTLRKPSKPYKTNGLQGCYNDFEPNLPTSATRMSTASSQFTEDWDADSHASPRRSGSEFNELNESNSHTRQAPLNTNENTITLLSTGVLTDRKNLASPPAELSEWSESGPLTPSKRFHTQSTENWDDDFEDNSPARKSIVSASPSAKLRNRTRTGGASARIHRRAVDGDEAHESWDEEFGLGPPPSRRSPQKLGLASSPGRKPRHRRVYPPPLQQHPEYSSSSDDDEPLPRTQPVHYPPSDDDEDMEFGYVEKEDDRTVTARSRRAALSRLTNQTSSSTMTPNQGNNSPPPPVPALPFLLSPLSAPTSLSPHPFPRSPTSSVFSVPTTLAETRSFTSTTHLRPTPSRASSGLSRLPPSPPIHKERERRRLRKKSRPNPNGVFELATITAGQIQPYSFSDGELDGGIRRREERALETEDDHIHPRPPRTPSPSPHPPASMPATPSGGASSINATPSSSNKGAALLSRIGSVTRWGARRKRGSSMTPSEVVATGVASHKGDTRLEDDPHLTPRPQSSLSSLHHSASRSSNPSNNNASSPPTSNHWFFRASSAGSPLSNLGGGSSVGSRSGSVTDLSLRERERASMYTPSPESGLNVKSKEAISLTPSKLIKRKSLGFVHLRRGFGGHNGGENDRVNGSGKGEAKRPMSMVGKGPEDQQHAQAHVQPRHASYGAMAGGRPGRSNGVEGRDRKRSFARSRSRDPITTTDAETDKENDKGKEKEGARGFMGNVRRMSLVGRHKRTKSGVSLAHIGEGTLRQTPPRPLTPSTSYPHSISSRRQSIDPNAAPSHNPLDPPPSVPKTPEKPPTSLLPPIELQPPSPPQVRATVLASDYISMNVMDSVTPKPSHTAFNSPSSPSSMSPTKLAVKSPNSPQSASLGRSTTGAVSGSGSGGAAGSGNGSTTVPRRNSLGDLKIPARISQAQVGLRRDLGMVREFAASVEQLKELQMTYHELVSEVQTILDRYAELHSQQRQPLPRTTSPNFFSNLSKPKMRRRSSTNPEIHGPSSSQLAYKEIASAFYTINSKYRISWECAELLIELGSGTNGGVTSPPSASASVPIMQHEGASWENEGKKGRERAITLAGDESKPPTPIPGATNTLDITASPHNPPLASPPSWRASTGRHDLSHRQLTLLREMLKIADSSFDSEGSRVSIPEEPPSSLNVNRDWRWGDPMSSTITLPSEEGVAVWERTGAPTKTRRSSRLGMSGIRDILRSLKRNNADAVSPPVPAIPPVLASSTSLSTESSVDSHSRHRYPHPRIPPKRRPKSSNGPESIRSPQESDTRPTSPYSPSSFSVPKSPRRPSLASIFRLGSKNKVPTPPSSSTNVSNHTTQSTSSFVPSQSGQESSSTGEEDWDRIDSASDLDAAAKALGINPDGCATVRGAKGLDPSPYLARDPYGLRSTSGPASSKRSVNCSQTSLHGESLSNGTIPSRSTRLSNVEEQADDHRPTRTSISKGNRPVHNSSQPPSRTSKVPKSGSVRSMPPQVASSIGDPKLSVTPDNIKPLLENAREVQGRLLDCIAEIRSLVGQSS